MLAAASRFQMARKNANPMEAAKRLAEKAKPTRKAKLSDSSSLDELEKSNASSTDEEKVPKKSEKKTNVP